MKWTNEEISFLKQNYSDGDEIYLEEKLSRNFKSISEYARKLGLKRNNHFLWQENEISFLKENFEYGNKDFLCEKLNRNWNAIFFQGRKLGLSRKTTFIWTDERVEKLKEIYPILSESECCEILENSWANISAKASKLGIKRNYNNDISWTNEKIEILKSYYFDASWESLYKLLNTKNKSAILCMGEKLGLERKRKFKESEDLFILNNYSKLSISEISNFLKRSYSSIAGRMGKLKVRNVPKWNNVSDDELLKKLYGVGIKLNRTPAWRELTINGLPSGFEFKKRFGSFQEACCLSGLETSNALYGNPGYSKNNDWCKSQSEIFITNFFIDNNIFYEMEIKYSTIFPNIKTNKSADWFIDDVCFVEYFGLPDKKEYQIKMNEKIELFRNSDYMFIYLLPQDLNTKKLTKTFSTFIK